jgi:hypothetical protein
VQPATTIRIVPGPATRIWLFADAQQAMTYSAAAAFVPFIPSIPAKSLLRRGTSMAALPKPLKIVRANKKIEQGWRG